jgi:hypothetical protein
MRRLRQLSMAVLLTLMLGTSALAGTIDTPPAPAPEPPSATATGIIECPPSDAQPVAAPTDPVVDIVLNLLQSALSLF